MADLTYPEVGATLGPALPAGYEHLRRRDDVGRGEAHLERAGDLLLGWDMHRRAGLTVEGGDDGVVAGADVRIHLRVGPGVVTARNRVVRVLREPRVRGFVYGSLPGHPLRGEELFRLRLDADDVVRCELVAFWRPARWYSRVGLPVTRAVQHRITERYVAALRAA